MYSNDLTEVSKPDWREIITEDAVRDIGRWLGVDFYPISGVPETPVN